MTRGELIARALACAGAVGDDPFGEGLLTIKAGGKVFAWIPLDEAGWLGQGPRMAVKLPAELVAELRHAYPGQVRPARPLDQRLRVDRSAWRGHRRRRGLGAARPVLPRGRRPPAAEPPPHRSHPRPPVIPSVPQPDRPTATRTDPEPGQALLTPGHPRRRVTTEHGLPAAA